MFLDVPPPPPPAAARTFDGKGRESLEEFLAKARAKQAELFAKLGTEVDVLVKRFEAMNLPASAEAREQLIGECLALGSEAVPLFVPKLDPGDSGLEKERFRAAQIAQVLLRVDTRSATGELLSLLARGSKEGRARAVQVLENSSEPERVRPVLLQAFRATQGTMRASLLRALLKLGPPDLALLDEVLGGDDAELCDTALTALTDAKNAEVEPRVHTLLAHDEKGPLHALPLLMYYQAQPELVGSAQLKDLLELAGTPKTSASARLAIVDALPQFVTTATNDLKKALEPILTGPDLKLGEAARIVLARLGNNVAKRELLKAYDELVEGNPKWSQAWVRRADILRRIGEYRDAEKDYKKALELGVNENQPQPETHIGLARCAALQGKFKEAAGILQKAPLPLSRLKSLGSDPDFAKMRTTKYGEVFRAD